MRRDLGSSATLRGVAAVLLGLALAAIGGMHYASQRMIAIQGPGAMQALDATLWLGVNDELWVLDANGARIARKPASAFGLAAAISNIVAAPDGQVLLTSREDTAWQVVNRADLSRVRTVKPDWPAQFKEHSSGAIHLAISPDWDIAVATGGGHTVLLFDRDGKFIARTPPGLYRFTNGLWHSPEGWWTTDTNSFKLRLLETRTLALKQTVDLRDNRLPYAFLGELAHSNGAAQAGTGQVPLATVSRVGSLMEPGHVVDVFADGGQAVYNKEPLRIVRDLSWFNGQLLVVDGAKYEIARFSARRDELARFGDTAVTADLDAMLRERERWTQLSSRTIFLAAAAALLLGIAAYSRSKAVARAELIRERRPWMVGTPALTVSQSRRQWTRVVALPALLRLAFIVGLVFWLPGLALPWLKAGGLLLPGFWGGLLSKWLLLWLPLLIWFGFERRRYNALCADPAREAILNRRAVNWLARHDDFDRIAQPGEQPRETMVLLGWRPRWLLVTNRRILLFMAGPRDRRLVGEWARSSVVHAAGERPMAPRRLARLWRRWFRWRVNIHVRFRDGSVLEGFAASQVTAQRVVQLLAVTRSSSGETAATGEKRRRPARRWREVIASALIPGLGQLMQDRFASGAVLLTAAGLLLMLVVGPVLWAASGPKMEVSPANILVGAAWWLLLAGAAALDAWHFSAARPRANRHRTGRAPRMP